MDPVGLNRVGSELRRRGMYRAEYKSFTSVILLDILRGGRSWRYCKSFGWEGLKESTVLANMI
jgi:hypothetical protein